MTITASLLYDLVQCPHRVTMNLFEDPSKKDPVSPFVELLWERGALFEKEVIDNLNIPYADFSGLRSDAKRDATLEAMKRGDELIYAGRIEADDLVGEPDLLRREGSGYVPIDIKSGRGEESGGDEVEGKPKVHYAVQLGLYLDILERLGVAGGRIGYIWDIHGEEVPYELDLVYGVRTPRTIWQDYQDALGQAREIVGRQDSTTPALAAFCKLCVWRSVCIERLRKDDDLTLIPELGRSRRESMQSKMKTVHQLANCNPQEFIHKKKTDFPGIGPDSLIKYHLRAQLLCRADPAPYVERALILPDAEREIFFDIEVDPLRDICYLHGFVTRMGKDNDSEQFTFFFADEVTDESEETAFRKAWQFLQESKPHALYYYSKYERTIYRKLQAKYPHVCGAEDVEALFGDKLCIDLYYDAVQKGTYWPTYDHSIKTLASFLGFKWRDIDPSGAASIEWYDSWVRSKEPAIKHRILEYNEDDCRATRILLDGLRNLPVVDA